MSGLNYFLKSVSVQGSHEINNNNHRVTTPKKHKISSGTFESRPKIRAARPVVNSTVEIPC